MVFNNVYEKVIFTISSFAMTLQIYVFVIIVYKSPPVIKEYRSFLCFYTFWDFWFNFTMGIILIPTFQRSNLGFVANGLASYLADCFGYDVIRLSGSLLFFCGVYVIASQDYCLLYRYCIINTNSKFYEWLISWKGIISFHTFMLMINLFLTSLFHSCATTVERKAYYLTFFNWSDPLEPSFDKYFLIDYSVPTMQLWMYSTGGLFVTNEILCFLLVFHIWKLLSANKTTFTQKTYKLFQQLTRILIFQLITPIICMALPVITGIFLLIIGVPASAQDLEFGFGILTIYPCFNAFVTIVFVTPYWNFTKKWLKKLGCCKQVDQNPVFVMPTTKNSNSNLLHLNK